MGLPFAQYVPEQSGGFSYDFLPNERLKLIVTKIGHTYEYEKELKLKMQKESEKALAFGDDFAPAETSHKIGGMKLECVVIARSNEAYAPALRSIVNQTTPKESLITLNLEMPAPFVIHNKTKFSYQNGVDSDKIKNGLPFFGPIFPRINECGAKIDGKYVSLSKMNDLIKTSPEGLQTLADEANRNAMWDALITHWNNMSEQEATEALRMLIASWAGIVHKSDLGKFKTILPEVGTVWEVGVSGPQYVTPVPAKYDSELKKTVWNCGWTVETQKEKAMVLAEKLKEYDEEDMKAQEAW